MLVLTRRLGESVLIGEDICITIISQRGKQIKLGFDVPKNIPILRKEIIHKYKNFYNEDNNKEKNND